MYICISYIFKYVCEFSLQTASYAPSLLNHCVMRRLRGIMDNNKINTNTFTLIQHKKIPCTRVSLTLYPENKKKVFALDLSFIIRFVFKQRTFV